MIRNALAAVGAATLTTWAVLASYVLLRETQHRRDVKRRERMWNHLEQQLAANRDKSVEARVARMRETGWV